MAKLPSNIQTCRKVLHLEVDKHDLEFVEHLVKYAKSNGIYRQWWGPHAHPTEGVDWTSTPGDIKRAAKFAVRTTNYNASMTSIDVHGFLDLNDVITIRKPDGMPIKTSTGRECLTTLFKFQDNSPLIAEVHQQTPLGPASLVYPNTPEGEKLITGLAKQMAAFTRGHLSDLHVDSQFIQEFLGTFIDPQLVHEADQCEWDSETQTLLTPAELAENSNSKELEEQGWWKDVVVQHDVKQKQGKRSYASQQALFDLDGTQSIKTMHEANDGASTDLSNESSKRVKISQNNSVTAPPGNRASNGRVSQEVRNTSRSGHTPPSVGVRDDVRQDMEYSSEESTSSSGQDANSTASDADPSPHPPGTTG
jgi:hypothetical protein